MSTCFDIGRSRTQAARRDRGRERAIMSAPLLAVIGATVLAAGVVTTVGCEREARPYRELPAAAARAHQASETPLYAGAPSPPTGTASPFQQNAWGLSEGKRLFVAYNCVGCHAQGGGAIGPPLMDDEWIYGFEPRNIYDSIVQGRPDGMPSFRNKIPESQVWQLVAYVQSMSGQTPIDASPGRADHMPPHTPETISPYVGRRQTGHR